MFESSLYNKLYNINQEKINKVTAQNLRAGVNIFNVTGNFTSDANVDTIDIANGKIAYSNGARLVGSLREYTNINPLPVFNIGLDVVNSKLNAIYIDRIYNQANSGWYYIPTGIIRNNANITIPYNTITSKLGISPTDIKKDVRVFDIVGTYDASTEFEGIKMDPVTASTTAIPLTASISEISGLDTVNGTNMAGFFSNLRGLTSISNLDLTNVTNISFLFQNDIKLTTIKYLNMYNSDISNTGALGMFMNCNSITNIDDTVLMPKLINHASSMFYNCSHLVDINTSINIRTESYDQMFYNCNELQSVENIHFIPYGTGTTSTNMFAYCRKLNFESLDLTGVNLNYPYGMFSNSNISNATSVENMLNNLSSLRFQSSMFSNCNLDKALNIENFEHVLVNSTSTSTSHSFDYMYIDCPKITQGDINVSNFRWCAGFRYALYNCINLQSSNISLYNDWKPTNEFNAYNFQYTFTNCTNLTDVNILCNNATFYFQLTFQNCFNLKNITMPTNWHIANNTFTNVFTNCISLENLDDVIKSVTNQNNIFMPNAFYGCQNLKYDEEIILNSNSTGCLTGVFTNCRNITNNLTINIQQHNNASVSNSNCFAVGAGFNNVHFILNYSKMINSYYGSAINYVVSNCSNLQHFDADIYLKSIIQNPSRKTGFYRVVTNCSNITDINYNFELYNDYTFTYAEESLFSNCPNLTNLNVNITYGKVNNTSIVSSGSNNSNLCYIISDCNKITTFNLNTYVATNINNLAIAKNCYNLTDIDYNITFTDSFDYVWAAPLFNNCPNLSDTLIDNLLGTLNNIPNYRGIKKLSYVFINCNISNVRYESLNNYAGLVAKGWTVQ